MLRKIVLIAVALMLIPIGVFAECQPSTGFMTVNCQVTDGSLLGRMTSTQENFGNLTSILGMSGFVAGRGTLEYTSAVDVKQANQFSAYDLNVIEGRASGNMFNSQMATNVKEVEAACAGGDCDIKDQCVYSNTAYMYSTYDITGGQITSAVSGIGPTMAGQVAGNGAGSMSVYGGWLDMSGTGVVQNSENAGSNYIEANGVLVNMDVAFLYGY